jgi:hypothetical protein
MYTIIAIAEPVRIIEPPVRNSPNSLISPKLNYMDEADSTEVVRRPFGDRFGSDARRGSICRGPRVKGRYDAAEEG